MEGDIAYDTGNEYAYDKVVVQAGGYDYVSDSAIALAIVVVSENIS